MTVTSTGTRASALAAASPPNPAPTTTTCGRACAGAASVRREGEGASILTTHRHAATVAVRNNTPLRGGSHGQISRARAAGRNLLRRDRTCAGGRAARGHGLRREDHLFARLRGLRRARE